MMVCFLFSLKDAIEALDRPLTPSPEPMAEPVVMMSMTFFSPSEPSRNTSSGRWIMDDSSYV